jgi:hypothetical protein
VALRNLCWNFYIFLRAKLLSHSKNILECLPLLLTSLWIVFVDIDDEQFPQNVIQSIKEECAGNVEEMFYTKKNEYILKSLVKRLENCSEIRLIELRDSIRLFMSKCRDLEGYMVEKTQTKFNYKMASILQLSQHLSPIYGNTLKYKHFDERIFITGNTSADHSPVKITPFKRQKLFNFPINDMKKPTVFKKLDYSLSSTSSSIATNVNTTPNMSYTPNTYSNLRYNNFENATPCSRVFLMDKWVTDFTLDWTEEKLTNFLGVYII